MQPFVVGKRGGRWCVEAVLNARRLTLERQLFLDAVDALPAEVRRRLSDLVQPSRRQARERGRPCDPRSRQRRSGERHPREPASASIARIAASTRSGAERRM
jgi:hypothetical protein